MFRRSKDRSVEEPVEEPADAPAEEERSGPRADGPWDVAEVERSDDDGRVDLGSLLIAPVEGLELQLQVDEASGQPIAAVLAGREGAVELRAFAAPRHGDIWDDVRRQVAAEVARLGGIATESEGPWGTELVVSLTVTDPGGGRGTQVSRVVGIPGPRWLLRATMFGRPAVEHRHDGDVETALRQIVVVRGTGPAPPGDALPLSVPPTARRVDPA